MTAMRSPLSRQQPNLPAAALSKPSTTADKPASLESIDAKLTILDDVLGRGGFGTIHRGKLGTRDVAVKIVSHGDAHDPESFAADIGADIAAEEVELHSSLMGTKGVGAFVGEDADPPMHASIVQFITSRAEPERTLLVLELVAGVDLYEQLAACPTRRLEPADARKIVMQLVDALAFCHTRGVAHLDVKADNLLIGAGFALKLIDFGSAAICEGEDAWAEERGGTDEYMSPERLDGGSLVDEHPEYACELDDEGRFRGPAADVYSVGVVATLALSGQEPFDFSARDADGALVDTFFSAFERLEAGDPGFSKPAWVAARVGADATDFVRVAMRCGASARPSAEALLRHAWLAGPAAGEPEEAVEALVSGAAFDMSELQGCLEEEGAPCAVPMRRMRPALRLRG